MDVTESTGEKQDYVSHMETQIKGIFDLLSDDIIESEYSHLTIHEFAKLVEYRVALRLSIGYEVITKGQIELPGPPPGV